MHLHHPQQLGYRQVLQHHVCETHTKIPPQPHILSSQDELPALRGSEHD